MHYLNLKSSFKGLVGGIFDKSKLQFFLSPFLHTQKNITRV